MHELYILSGFYTSTLIMLVDEIPTLHGVRAGSHILLVRIRSRKLANISHRVRNSGMHFQSVAVHFLAHTVTLVAQMTYV